MNKKFEYTYSAPTEEERREIEAIRSAYVTDERAEKFARLRKLHARVKNLPFTIALCMGVVGLLLFGAGMAAVLSFGELVAGSVVAAVGIVPMALAAPVYNAVLRHEKAKHADEIVRLSEELLGDPPSQTM